MPKMVNKVSSDAVERATGRGWDAWIAFIDGRGGGRMDHKQIVKLVGTSGGVDSGWWQQMVTVGYEHAKGRRQTGETTDAGFQVGVQRAIPAAREALWELLTSGPGRRAWLGSVRSPRFEPGTRMKSRAGLEVEVRTVKPGHRLRLAWRPAGRAADTTLQLTLSCPRNTRSRTTLRFHHEKLADEAEREDARVHWRAVLEELAKLAARA